MLDWLCTKMAKPPTIIVPGRNSAAHSVSPKPAFALVTTKTGITGRKTGVALNTGSSPRITGFPLTAAASVSREHTPCVQSASVTIPALRRLDRNGCGCAQRRQRGKPQHTGPHLRFSGCAGRRSAWFSLLPFCQTASAFRLICLFHTFCRRGVHRAMVFAPLRCPNLFRFPFACLWATPSACFAHHFISFYSR